MPITDTSMFRQRSDIVAEMLAQLIAAIPDAHTGDDGVARILIEIDAGQLENLYLANQLLLEDMFVGTASYQALIRHGEQYGVVMNMGTSSVGQLQFEGSGGTYIPIGTQAAYDPGSGLDVIFFDTTVDGTIPNPGDPTAPNAAVHVAAGNLNGLYEYVVTFETADGETLPSPISAAVNPANQQVDLSAIPVGGAGTIARRIYRDKNGAGVYRLVTTIADNVTVVYTDNITDAAVAASPLVPAVDTAHQITLDAQAEVQGIQGNVAIGTITDLTSAPANLLSVTNLVPFTGGFDQEDIEDFRTRLLSYIQNPQTGSAADLQTWAENVPGVGSAAVFPNTPVAGTVTVRISALDGGIPTADLITDVQNALDAVDIANIIVDVASFTPVPTNVNVTLTRTGTYTLADVTPTVTTAITEYINNLSVGDDVFISGIVAAIVGLPGIADVVVTAPAANVVIAADSKAVPGAIVVA